MRQAQYLIIGDPITHSLSPQMQNAAFRKHKLAANYKKTLLKKSQLNAFFKKIHRSGISGLNVTVPHKENVLSYVDHLSPEAKLIGAANTLHIREGKIFGYNTDGAGYVQSLWKEKRWKPKGKKILLLGAGGAARGIAVALSLAGAREILFANRTEVKAKKIAKEFARKLKKTKWESCSLNSDTLAKVFPKIDLIVNTTSGGMNGNELPSLPLKRLRSKTLVSDIVYRPALTPLLKEARKLKLKTLGGLGMLLYQGALAFEIWTGKAAPTAQMKSALTKALSKRS